MIGEALELRHRLPRIWLRVVDLEVPAWRARLVARETMTLSMEAADFVDRQVAHVAHALTSHRVERIVTAAIARFDPERAAREAKQASDSRGVRVVQGHDNGVVHITIDCDAADGRAFDETVDDVADSLGRLGDADRKQVRRSKAIGILADPQQALDLLCTPSTGGRAASGTRALVRLHVHLSDAALRSGAGVARVEGLGPVTLDVVRRWLGRTDVSMTPVLHAGSRIAVDAYEIPDAMREGEIVSSPHCVFPWCNRESRDCDIDHTVPYLDPGQGGPPGQTTAANLGPLCRRHHRLKTHGRWKLEQPVDGVFVWSSPHGRTYRVDQSGTVPLGDVA